MKRLLRLDPSPVALVGAAVGFGALAAGWLNLRPNRLAAGTGLGLIDGLGGGAAAVIIGLWLAVLVFSLVRWRWRAAALGAAANLILVLTFVFIGLAAGRLLGGQPAIARVSPGAGFWLTLAGTYVAIYAARRKLGGRLWRTVVSFGGLAVFALLLFIGFLGHLSILVEFSGYRDRFVQELVQHIRLFGISVAIATVIGIPLGIWATRSKLAARPIFFITGIVQTVPSLALFGLLIAPLAALSFAFPALRAIGIRGVGVAPAVIALVIYSLLPVVQNTFTGIRQVAPAAVDAGRGMGMSRRQVLLRVEAPLAAPLILEGVRTASVQAVGLAAVAALIGAGGLGWFIFQGIGQAASDLIILGAIPIIVLALAVDAIMRAVVRLGTPRGLEAGR